MILELWPEDQEGPVKKYGGGLPERSENIHQHCIYLALTACVLYLLYFKRDHFEWYVVVRGSINPPDNFKGDRIPRDTGRPGGQFEQLSKIFFSLSLSLSLATH